MAFDQIPLKTRAQKRTLQIKKPNHIQTKNIQKKKQ